jgi:hypothetical protein
MQLRTARLCLDCEEIHDQQTCPACLSESFAFISRWIPAPERRARVREPQSREAADIYAQLVTPQPPSSAALRWMRRGVLGLAAAGLAGLIWRQKPADREKAASGRKDTG